MIDWLKTRRENRNLKREIRLADNQIFALQDRVDALNKEVTKYRTQAEQQEANNNELKEKNRSLHKQLRNQCAAELLVNALVALGVFPKPKKSYDPYKEQARLQSMLGQHQGALGSALEQQSALRNLIGG